MKRDFSLLRKLLIFFYQKEHPNAIEVPPIEGYDEITIKNHLVLMYEAGLLRCEPVRSSTSDRVIYVIPFNLTWNGHEFLAKVRDERAWQRVLAAIQEKRGALAFSIINKIATKLAMDLVS